MVGRTNAGGAGELRAVIAVTYPAGSVCTCSDGTTTLTARDTSGAYLFNVPSAGTWTVTARTEDGSREKSVDVTITDSGQVESVTLIYELVLYSNGTFGVPFSARAGVYGSTAQQAPKITENLEFVRITQVESKSGSYFTVNAVDVTGYNTLKLKYKHIYTGSGSNVPAWCLVGLASSPSADWNGNWLSIKQVPVTSSIQELTLDISSVTGSYYIGLGEYHGRAVDIYDLILC